MCRLYGFRANEPTKVECTLVHAQNALMIQSRSDRRGMSHADGWGVAWYTDRHEPTVERRDKAAHQDVHFSHVAERVFATSVVAHVRKATVGTPSGANTHPFVRGPWTFAHNGTLRGFDRLETRLESKTPPDLWSLRAGETDSEAIFLWLMGRLDGEPRPEADALAGVLAQAVWQLAKWSAPLDERPSKLNVVLTDGHVLVATCWNNSLYWLARDNVRDCELCGIPHVRHHEGVAYRAVLVASEPITHEAWRPVPDPAVVVVDRDLGVRIRPIGEDAECSVRA